MADEIRTKLGTKLTDEEKRSLDPSKVEHLRLQPPEAPVEGQYFRQAHVICPYCGCGLWVTESTDVTLRYTCACCGNIFRY